MGEMEAAMGVHRPQRGAFAVLALNIAVIALSVGSSEELSNEDCLTLGFAESLECNTCEKMHQFVPDTQLYKECRDCCRVVSNDDNKYDEAKLQICD